jgi:hypothetical protein
MSRTLGYEELVGRRVQTKARFDRALAALGLGYAVALSERENWSWYCSGAVCKETPLGTSMPLLDI